MKKLIKIILVLSSFSLTSCGLINYVETSSSIEQSIIEELSDRRAEYFDKLNDLFSENNYYETERRVFIETLIEAKAELIECLDISTTQKIFDDYVTKLKAIKTKEQYNQELMDKKDRYIDMVKDISDEELYRDTEKDIYLFYVDNAIKAIENLKSTNDDFDKIYATYKEIIEAIKTNEDYLVEETYVFEKYKNDAIKDIADYVSLSDYREVERAIITTLIEKDSNAINESKTYEEVDYVVRDYKTAVYQYETDKELYQKELLTFINESKTEITEYVNPIKYRDNEVILINTLIDTFKSEVDELRLKEDVLSLLNSYKSILSSIKTSSQLYDEEKQILIDNLFIQLKVMVDYNNLSTEDKNYYDAFYASLNLISTKEEVQESFFNEKLKYYEAGAIAGDDNSLLEYKKCLIEVISNHLDKSQYREEQKLEIESIINNAYYPILSCLDYDALVVTYNDVINQLDVVLTNEEMWEKEDLDFYNDLHALYGDDILVPAGSLTIANDVYELADIVDYYAFYQLDATSFVRDRFRVKANFEYFLDELPTELDNICELLKQTVGIQVENENGYIVIELIPYNFWTITHRDLNPVVNGDPSPLSFPITGSLDRGNDFDDFAINTRVDCIKVWNNQQLWYAVEHGYYPIYDTDSNAYVVYERAKAILREVVGNEMTDIQKVWAIWNYLSLYVDRDDYPKLDHENYKATIFFPEGALINNLAVCRGIAKSFVLLLGIEGIEAKKVSHISGIHDYVYLKINDKWYSSDVDFSRVNGTFVSIYPIFNNDSHRSLQKSEIVLEDHYLTDFYDHITYHEKSIIADNINQLSELVDLFDFDTSSKYLNILVNTSIYNDAYHHLVNDGRYNFTITRYDFHDLLKSNDSTYYEIIIRR